jgi:hypothetical protein
MKPVLQRLFKILLTLLDGKKPSAVGSLLIDKKPSIKPGWCYVEGLRVTMTNKSLTSISSAMAIYLTSIHLRIQTVPLWEHSNNNANFMG